MTNRFDFEQQLMLAWSTKEDLDNILWKIMDSADIPDEDKLSNLIIGVSCMHDIRMEKLFDMFQTMIMDEKIK